MPVTPTYPGVYVEEIPSGVHTITGVATSIAAFLGHSKEGPVNKAIRLLSYSDFEKNFGQPFSGSELGYSVRLFFQNGGTDCYVVRLIKTGTGGKSSIILKNEAGTDVLKFTAKEIGAWGNELAVDIDYGTSNPEDTFHTRIYRIAADGTIKAQEEFLNCSMDSSKPRFVTDLITQSSRLVDCELVFADEVSYLAAAPDAGYSEARRPFTSNPAGRDELAGILAAASNTSKFKISIDDSPFYEIDLADAFATGSNESTVTGNIKNKINSGLPPSLQNTADVSLTAGVGSGGSALKVLRFTSNTSDIKSVMVQPGSNNDLTTVLMMGTDQGGIEKTRFSVLRPAPSGTFFSLSKLSALANLAQSNFSKITIDGQIIDLGTSLKTTTSAGTHKWYEDADNKFDGVREKFAIMAAAINNANIGWTAKVDGYRLSVSKNQGLNNYSSALTTDGTPDDTYFIGNTRLYALGSGIGNYTGTTQSGVNGDPPDYSAYQGSQLEHKGFYALDLIDIFNLMILPKHDAISENDYRSLWASASSYCKDRRAFLLIDSPESWSKSYDKVTDPTIGIKKLRVGVYKDYSAVFYPKITINDQGIMRNIGAAGAIAGIFSRIDSERGVWKAPSGLDADVVGISGLNLNLTDLENGVLNKQGVNCIRSFPSGIVHWGARTMDGADDFGSEWKYLPIRRLALFLEESLYRGTKWIVFEPNDEPLWAKIRLNVNAFMMGLFRQGAFQGSTPDKAFFVKCDKETTTQADRNLGIVNILVGFAPLKPAEFVIIKIQQIAGEL